MSTISGLLPSALAGWERKAEGAEGGQLGTCSGNRVAGGGPSQTSAVLGDSHVPPRHSLGCHIHAVRQDQLQVPDLATCTQ